MRIYHAGEALAFAFALALALGLRWLFTAQATFLKDSTALPNSLALKGHPHPCDTSNLFQLLVTEQYGFAVCDIVMLWQDIHIYTQILSRNLSTCIQLVAARQPLNS